MIEKNIGKSLQIELVTNYNSNDAHKERLVGGSKSAMGGGGRGHIRRGSKSAVTPYTTAPWRTYFPSGHEGEAFLMIFLFIKKLEMISIK